METGIAEWLDGLPPALGRQRDMLRRFVAAVERDPTWRFLVVGCSVARGAGDGDSDLDMALGVEGEAWPGALDAVPALVGGLGAVVDLLSHRPPEWGGLPALRTFVQYADGVQLDLVVQRADTAKGRAPGTVVLHDPDGRFARPWSPPIMQADAASVREWAFLGWAALADLAKYLRRGSSWEALERLHAARGYTWRLWAVARDVAYPAFGLTSVLDEPGAGLPPGIDETVASLNPRELQRAALATAALLEEVTRLAAPAVDAEQPLALAAYVRRQLAALPHG